LTLPAALLQTPTERLPDGKPPRGRSAAWNAGAVSSPALRPNNPMSHADEG
jgi:hypothetical protein